MNTLKFTTYTYFGSGADTKQFQMPYTLFQDDVLYEQIKAKVEEYETSPVTIQHWTDVTMPVDQAVSKINTFLGGARYIGNNVPYYVLDPLDSGFPNTAYPIISGYLNKFRINSTLYRPNTGAMTQTPTKIALLNGTELNNTQLSNLYAQVKMTAEENPPPTITHTANMACGGNGILNFVERSTSYKPGHSDFGVISLTIPIFKSDFIVNNMVNSFYEYKSCTLLIDIYFDVDVANRDILDIFEVDIRGAYSETQSSWYRVFDSIDLNYTMPEEDDQENPYGGGGTSGAGGGDGTLRPDGLDDIDPAEIPDLPSISAADLGFITIYNPSVSELKALSDFMWSGAFDLATYKKLFSDPMQSIIGLAIVPVAPSIAGVKNVKFGTIDSGVAMNYLSTNYVRFDCGWCDVQKYVSCFMDNEPYTKISLYLPFIGIRQLSADDVIGGSIHVVYNIDVLNGACACFVEHDTRGVLYSYNGSCITNVPLTSINFSGAIQNAVSAIGSAIGMVAGMATGAAPVAAMSALGLATSAANTAINSKPTVQRSGNLGGSAGIMSIMKPYVIIERPNLSVPNNVQHYVGQSSNITMRLANCSGFTMCEYVHLDNLDATADEILEIESMLKTGVIL